MATTTTNRNAFVPLPGNLDPTAPNFVQVLNDRFRRVAETANSALSKARQASAQISPPQAAANVTGLVASIIDAAPDATGQPQKQVTVTYTPPNPLGAFTGLWVYLDAPDSSQSEGPADGAAPTDGTQAAAGAFLPSLIAYFAYDGVTPQVRFSWPAPQIKQTWRAYLDSGDASSAPQPVEYGQPGATPSVAFEADPPGATAPSGVEWAPLATAAMLIPAETSLRRMPIANPTIEIKDSGDEYFRYSIQWAWPTTTDANKLGGIDVVVDDGELQQLEASVSYPGPSNFHSDWLPLPPGTTNYTIWLVSWNVNGNPNTLVAGVTPTVTFSLTALPGPSGTEYAPLVTFFAATLNYGLTVDGAEGWYLKGTWSNPDPVAHPEYGGVKIVAHNRSTGDDTTLAVENYPSAAFKTDVFSLDSTTPTYDIYAVSYDTNNNTNSTVVGVTPEVLGLQPVAQTSGALDPTRLAAAKLDATLNKNAGGGGKLGVNPGSLEIAHFASGIQPIVLAATDPSLPSATYPAGAYYFNTATRTLKRVNAAGTAWESGVNSNDIAANSITGGMIVAGAISSSQLNSTEIRCGGSGGPGQVGVYDGANNLVGWIGTNSGNVGAWFQAVSIGGGGFSSGVIQANGSAVSINGATFTLNKGGLTVYMDGNSSGLGAYGVKVKDNTSLWYCGVHPTSIGFAGASGTELAIASMTSSGRLVVSEALWLVQSLAGSAGSLAGYAIVQAGVSGTQYKIPLYNV